MEFFIKEFVSNANYMRNRICESLFDVPALQFTALESVISEESRKASESMNDLLFTATLNSLGLDSQVSRELSMFKRLADAIVDDTVRRSAEFTEHSEVRVLGLPKSLADRYTRERIRADEIIELAVQSVDKANRPAAEGGINNGSVGVGVGVDVDVDSKPQSAVAGQVGSLSVSDAVYASIFTDGQKRPSETKKSDAVYFDTIGEARRTIHAFEKRAAKLTKRCTRQRCSDVDYDLDRRLRKVANGVLRRVGRPPKYELGSIRLSGQCHSMVKHYAKQSEESEIKMESPIDVVHVEVPQPSALLNDKESAVYCAFNNCGFAPNEHHSMYDSRSSTNWFAYAEPTFGTLPLTDSVLPCAADRNDAHAHSEVKAPVALACVAIDTFPAAADQVLKSEPATTLAAAAAAATTTTTAIATTTGSNAVAITSIKPEITHSLQAEPSYTKICLPPKKKWLDTDNL